MDAIIGTQGPLLDVADNTLFNGMNVNSQGGGKRLQITFEPRMKHLLRFINVGVDNFYKVGLGKAIDQPILHTLIRFN